MRRLPIVAAVAIAMAFPRIGTTQQEKPQEQSSGVDGCIASHVVGGAIIGGVLGLLLGGNRRDNRAVQGAIAGGIVGFLTAWSKCSSQFTKVTSQTTTGYEEAAKLSGYSPDMGTMVRIEEFYLEPSALRPGNTVRLSGSYYVMAPNNSDVQVVETRVIRCQDPGSKQIVEIDRDTSSKTASPGYRTVIGELPIPSQAPANPGTLCQFELEVAVSDKKSQTKKQFIVTGNEQILARGAARDQQEREKRDSAVQQRAIVVAKADTQPQSTLVAESDAAGAKAVPAESSPTAAVASPSSRAEAPIRELLITAERTNVRSNPDAKAKVIGSVAKGERYPLFETVEISGRTWHQIRLDDGNKAWISSLAVKMAE